MPDDRVETGAVALTKANGGRASYKPHYSTQNKVASVLAAADAHDRAHGIVRVDCGSDDTVERVAAALARSNGTEWDLLPDEDNGECVYRRDARAVLLALQEGEKK